MPLAVPALLAALASVAGCGLAADPPAGSVAEAVPERLRPDEPLPDGVTIVAEAPPETAEVDGVVYDYRGAVRAVLNLHAALLRGEYTGGADTSALDRTHEGSPAADHVRERLAAAPDGPAPAGGYVLYGFEVGGYAPDLLQVDACLDRGRAPASGAPATGGRGESSGPGPGDVLWVGHTMRPDDAGAWRAAVVEAIPVGNDPGHHCAR
ncbi:hypothetical protein [Marinactinospora rubrisoli]|uniref:Lipoprotein n=1 Tax=Marinactinospora rubrisoli TaxID=2715399 RepID=A0ABW2KA71_9ACTN